MLYELDKLPVLHDKIKKNSWETGHSTGYELVKLAIVQDTNLRNWPLYGIQTLKKLAILQDKTSTG